MTGKLGRQPIEQFRMTRPLAQDAKIGRSGDDAAPKVMHPEAVDECATQEWMLATRQIASKSLSPTGGRQCFVLVRNRARAAAEHAQAARLDGLARLLNISTVKDLRDGNFARH